MYTSPCKQPPLTLPQPHFNPLLLLSSLRSIAPSLSLCPSFSPSLRLDRTFDSFGGNLQSSTLFPLPPAPAPLFFLSSPTDTSRVDLFDVIIPFTLGTYIPPTLTTLGLPPAGDDNNGNDLVLFHRIAIYIYIYILLSVCCCFFSFLSPSSSFFSNLF